MSDIKLQSEIIIESTVPDATMVANGPGARKLKSKMKAASTMPPVQAYPTEFIDALIARAITIVSGGSITFGGGDVVADDDGVSVKTCAWPPGNPNAYKFIKGSDVPAAWMTTHDDRVGTEMIWSILKVMADAIGVDYQAIFQIGAFASASKDAEIELKAENGDGYAQIELNAVDEKITFTGLLLIPNRTAPGASVANSFLMYSADYVAGNACPHFRTENGSIIKLFTAAAPFSALSTVTYTAPGTDTDAMGGGTSGGYGFSTADEYRSCMKRIANLQNRLAGLETKLQNQGLLGT